jgi:hypothetical protein
MESESEPVSIFADIKIAIDPANLDEEQFASLWNVASATMGGDLAATRELASKFLGFLCKKRCPFIVVSATDATYLDEWYERDNKLLYDWKAQSEKVDVLSQHAFVPFEIFAKYLVSQKFKPEVNHNPRRAMREEWFQNDWIVG